MRVSFADDMRGESNGTAVRKSEKTRVNRWTSPNLNEKRAEEKPSGKGEGLGEPGASA